MPSFWLLKTEPTTYSYDQLEREGRAVWDGVRNNLALKHLRSMKRGDQLLIYHSGDRKEVVGRAEVASEPYPDPKGSDAKLTVVDVVPRGRLPKPVPLATVRADPTFGEFALLRIPRLSVMPVSGEEWKRLLALAGDR